MGVVSVEGSVELVVIPERWGDEVYTIRAKRGEEEAVAIAHLKEITSKDGWAGPTIVLATHRGALFPGGACEFSLGYISPPLRQDGINVRLNIRATGMIQAPGRNAGPIHGPAIVLDRVHTGGFRRELSVNDIALFIGSRAKR